MIDTVRLPNQAVSQIDFPSICPHCSKTGHPYDLVADLFCATNPINNLLVVIFQCPSCEQTYCGEYRGYPLECTNIYPSQKPQLDIPHQIKEYFPDFYEIYEQSAYAETSGLDKIAGMAYRKSIEFLVKEYLIQKVPSEKENILKETLGTSIKRIDFPSIKVLATAVTWLGNDQTHVIQKHPEYNVQNIKIFTVALCHLIISEKVAEQATQLIRK